LGVIDPAEMSGDSLDLFIGSLRPTQPMATLFYAKLPNI